MDWMTRLSPRGRARVAGVFEFLEGNASSQGQVFLLGRLIVTGDAAATAHNILANETLFRFGFLLSVAGVAFHLVWGLFMYQLMKPVSSTLSALSVFFVITTSVLQALTAFFYLAPLLVLQGGPALDGLSTAQTQSLAMVFLKLNGAAFQLDLVFFGLWCLVTGYLIYRSTFLPRVLGVLLMVDGLGWTLYVWPPLATYLFPAIAVASGLAELPLQFWLIVFGANSKRWYEQAQQTQVSEQVAITGGG